MEMEDLFAAHILGSDWRGAEVSL